MKFAVLPPDHPGPDETWDNFTDRMGAVGNRKALDAMNKFLEKGGTFEEYRKTKNAK